MQPDDGAERPARRCLAPVVAYGSDVALQAFRKGLPVHRYREGLLHTINSNQVVLISGETGCGKTTQVPQYIMEEAVAAGVACRIVCTQPRRISAITVAERVANEWGEDIGGTVGYAAPPPALLRVLTTFRVAVPVPCCHVALTGLQTLWYTFTF